MNDKPQPSIPKTPPPFPPIDYLIKKERQRFIIGALIFSALTIFAYFAFFEYSPQESRGATGIPLRGLDSASSDVALKNAPAESFKVLSWDTLAPLSSIENTNRKISASEIVIPDELKKLSGEPIVVTGFMVPLDSGKRTLDFVIVPDMARCWFCDAPDQSRSIYCRGAFGDVESEYDRPIRAYGIIDIFAVESGGMLHSIVRLRVVKIEKL